ncbi:MAG TPA: thioesterase family protein [Acidimicrobiales bacterium]|jgi:acyl-CoA thioesterase|nr:thioesterase family protein [Acidimicrobiales bacterium]
MVDPFPSVTHVEGGRYRVELDPAWDLAQVPQGGIVTAIAVRAMQLALEDPGQRLRTLHAMFAAQVPHGPLEIDVEILRRGRSMSHARAEVRTPGAGRGHLTSAVFGASRRGFDFTDLEPPDPIVAPADCRSFREPWPEGFEGGPPMPFWERRVEGRGMLGHPPWESYQPGRAEHGTWYRMDEVPWRDDGTLDPLALIVFSDTMPGAVAERIGPDERSRWFGPSVDLTFHLFDDCRSEWVLAHNRARQAGDGYASVDMALWDCGPEGRGTPRLVAYATQMMFFSFSD